MKKVLFSGSAPSGLLTIGNYIGALQHWKRYQAEYDSIFCIVDLHAITTPQDPKSLQSRSIDFLALFIACGLDPEKSTIFLQSHNHFHTELAWILNCITGYGELTRMTQFKDKAAKSKTVTAGLLNYPILMAADILLYGTALVPVGDDQRQHIELTRQIAQRFNSTFGQVMTIPEGFVPANGSRIRNLVDPTRKMDKSDPNPRTYISLLDSPEDVLGKIQKAKTDSIGNFPIDEKEGIANLVTIFSEVSGEPKERIIDRYRSKGYASLKRDLAADISGFLSPIQNRFMDLRRNEEGMVRYMNQGRDKALERAEQSMSRIREAIGLA